MKLFFYLKNKHYERWGELTSIGNLIQGASNPFKWFPYLYSRMDNEDEIILHYKDRIKFGLKITM